MPVPKGIDPKKYDDCVKQVKRKQGEKVNAYAVCNSSLKKNEGKKCMGNNMKKDEVKKALTAGYDTGEPAEEIKEVDPTAQTTAKPASEAAPATPATTETKATTTPAPTPEVKAEPKEPSFGNLFKPFTLGATLKPQEHGNVMTNLKKPAMDYVNVEKNSTKNIKMTAEDFKPKK